jgi:hypothetical protein
VIERIYRRCCERSGRDPFPDPLPNPPPQAGEGTG